MDDDMVCDLCGMHLSEHEIYDHEAPPTHRTDGVFAGEVWKGLLCPETYHDEYD